MDKYFTEDENLNFLIREVTFKIIKFIIYDN